MTRAWQWARLAVAVTGAFALLALGIACLQLRVALLRVDVRELVAEARGLVEDVRQGYDRTWEDQMVILAHTEELLRQSNQTVSDLNLQLFGRSARVTLDTKTGRQIPGRIVQKGLLQAANESVVALNVTIQTTMREIEALGAGIRADTLSPLRVNLEQLARLSADLDQEIKTQGQGVGKTLVAYTAAAESFDKLLTDPNIYKIVGNVEGTTHNLDEGTKSVEMALRPLRQKAHWLKQTLKAAAGFFRFTYPVQ